MFGRLGAAVDREDGVHVVHGEFAKGEARTVMSHHGRRLYGGAGLLLSRRAGTVAVRRPVPAHRPPPAGAVS
ncbi:hypothetical protein GCM10027091_79360 [Streptomyces daliensis]